MDTPCPRARRTMLGSGGVVLLLTFVWLPAVGRCDDAAAPPVTAEVVEVRKIWDQAPHNAFTDLLRRGDWWYCAFREGKSHVSDDGRVRIVRSRDGQEWESAGLLQMDKYDLRDASLSETPDGRLMVLGGATVLGPPRGTTGSFVSFSDDGAKWTAPQIAVKPGRWLWKATWNDNKVYGVAYGTGGAPKPSALMASDDGTSFETLAPKLLDQGWPTEAALRFDDAGTAWCLHRRDDTPNTAMLGSAAPPYSDWKWRDLGAYLGGPNFTRTPHGEWIAAGRLLDGAARTSVLWLDLERGAMTELVKLPSGGDTSYPGLAWHDDLLWISYYSSHEGRTSIYLAKVKILPRK